MTSHKQPKRILIIAPLFGDHSAIHSALGFLLPALQSNHFEIHLITNSLRNTYYRWKGVYVYSSDHPSIAVIKTLQFFTAGLYLNLDHGLFQNEYQIKNWISIDQTEIQLLLDAIEKQEYNQISSSIQALINIIEEQISITDFDLDSNFDKSNDGFNLIAPFFETSEEGEFSRGILQNSLPHQININPVCVPSFFNNEFNINTNQLCSIRNTLIIIPTYYSHDEVTQLLSMYNNTASEIYIIYPALQHIQIILDHSATIILCSNYLKHKVLKIYGDQYNEKVLVLHKSLAVPTNDGDRKKEEVTRFITIISNHSEVHHLDYVCTSFIDLLKDSDNFELHICFLSNAKQSETYHYYNNLFASKQRLVCHYCEMNYAEKLLQSSDCYISINNTGCFDIYALKAAVNEVPVMAAQHETTFEYFDHQDILTYEFESESVHFEQNNNFTKLKHTVRKESIATELNRVIQHKELIQTKMKCVKRHILSKHNMDAWLLAFEYHINNIGGI